ncbi:hypothetical protein OROHE_022092 [Orobanche hederae]
MARLLRNASIIRRSLFPRLQESTRGLLESSTQLCNFSTKGRKKQKSDASDSGDENLSKKDLALKLALDQITASFGKGSIMWLGRTGSLKHTPVVSTGSFALDVALGIGGLPKGRVVEIYGPEASGKTTLALHVIAEAQKQGGYCVFVDAEHALDPSLAEAIGVNTENLLLSQPDCGEQALSLVDTLIRSGSVDVVVVDSVAALVPKSELDGEMGDAHMAMQARLMSQALRKLSHSLSLSQTILIFTNQVRAKLSTFGFGGPTEVTCGGNALKFYASVRLNIRRTGLVKKGEEFDIASEETSLGRGLVGAFLIATCWTNHMLLVCGYIDTLESCILTLIMSTSKLVSIVSEKKMKGIMLIVDQLHQLGITVGSQVVVKIVKNKHAPPFRTAEFELEFGRGISREAEIIDLGCKHKLITKSSSWFYLGDQSFNGKDAFKKYLSENESVRDELTKKLREKLIDVEPESGDAVVEEVTSSDATDEEADTAVGA